MDSLRDGEMIQMVINRPTLKCERCYYTWMPKHQDEKGNWILPVSCPSPKCRSPYWNKLRKSEIKALDDGGIHTFASELKRGS